MADLRTSRGSATLGCPEMSIPSRSDLLSLNYVGQGLPFAAIEGTGSQGTLALGFAFYGMPFLGALGGVTPATTGLRIKTTSGIIELTLVAVASAVASMGGAPMIRKNGTTYALYLVETTDPNASPVRIKTSTGIKAIRHN